LEASRSVTGMAFLLGWNIAFGFGLASILAAQLHEEREIDLIFG